MNAPAASVDPAFVALNIDCADPAALARFWGEVLGRPVSPGAVPGDMAVDVTDPAAGPRLIFHSASAPGTTGPAGNRLQPVLITARHDEETERLTGLGATTVSVIELPKVRQSIFADPEGNEFSLVTWQSE